MTMSDYDSYEGEFLPMILASPGEIDKDVIEQLAKRATQHNSDARKHRQWRRHNILKSKTKDLVVDRIWDTWQTKDLRGRLKRFITSTVNIPGQVVSNVCQVWSKGAVRKVLGVSDEAQEAFTKLVRETKFDARMPKWQRESYFVGPCWFRPQVRQGLMTFDVVSPAAFEPILDPTNPTGDPIGCSWQISDAMDSGTGAQMAVDDGASLRYFNLTGFNEVTSSFVTPVEITDLREAHGYGRPLGALLRFEEPDEDWFDSDRFVQFEDGAAEIGARLAAMGMTRKVQSHKLLIAVAPVDAVLPKGSTTAEPEKGIQVRIPADAAAADFDIRTLDFETSPKGFFEEIGFYAQHMGSSTGVSVTPTLDASGSFVLSYDHDQLTELRQQQVAWARDFETDFWCAVVFEAKRLRHRLADKLPTVEQVRDGFSVSYPPLSRRFSDPQVEMAWWEFRFRHGLSSVIDLARRDNPLATDDQLKDEVRKALEFNSEYDLALSRHNVSRNPENGARMTLPQQNGALGPLVRDGKVPSPDEIE